MDMFTGVVATMDRFIRVVSTMDRFTRVVATMDRSTRVVVTMDRFTRVVATMDRSTRVVATMDRFTRVVVTMDRFTRVVAWSRIKLEDELPPEALQRHWLRTCWVSNMWSQANQNHMALLDLNEYGWMMASLNVIGSLKRI